MMANWNVIIALGRSVNGTSELAREGGVETLCTCDLKGWNEMKRKHSSHRACQDIVRVLPGKKKKDQDP